MGFCASAASRGFSEFFPFGAASFRETDVSEIINIKERRRDLCVEFMKLGMDLEAACVAAEIPPEDVEELRSDEDFVRRVNFSLANREAELLRRLNEVAEENAERGETKQLERLLELMNPARYSKVTKLSHQVEGHGAAQGKVTVEFASPEADG